LAELLHRTIYFLGFYETKFGIFGEFFALATLGMKGFKHDTTTLNKIKWSRTGPENRESIAK